MDAVPAGYAASEQCVSLGSFGMGTLEPLGEAEKYSDPLAGDPLRVFGHVVSPRGLVSREEFIRVGRISWRRSGVGQPG